MVVHELCRFLTLTPFYGSQNFHVIHTMSGELGLLPVCSKLNEVPQGNLAFDGRQKEAVARRETNRAMKLVVDVGQRAVGRFFRGHAQHNFVATATLLGQTAIQLKTRCENCGGFDSHAKRIALIDDRGVTQRRLESPSMAAIS